MRIVIEPMQDRSRPIDLTQPLVDAIARELERRCGGNAILNRLEATAQLEHVLRHGRWFLAALEKDREDRHETPA